MGRGGSEGTTVRGYGSVGAWERGSVGAWERENLKFDSKFKIQDSRKIAFQTALRSVSYNSSPLKFSQIEAFLSVLIFLCGEKHRLCSNRAFPRV
jgi:hypothetical protein